MKVLLVGEFSGVHNQLMKQLIKEGHTCDLLSDGDGWKGFGNTISIEKRAPIKRFGKIIFPLLDFFGIAGLNNYLKQKDKINKLNNYDYVQFINPVAIKSFGAIGNALLFSKLNKNSNKSFLCALGGDFNVEKFYLSRCLKYSPWSGFNLNSIYHYYQNISFFFPAYLFLHFYICRKVKKIIPGLYEYKQAYIKNFKCSEVIGLPINIDEVNLKNDIANTDIVKILYSKKPHKGDFYKKGYGYFDEAIKLLKDKDLKFELITASGVSFDEYKKIISQCDVMLDQTLSYDRGMSAVIGMANGMITFSGNEDDVEKFYGKKIPCINATPNANKIFTLLEDIILNPWKYNNLRVEAKAYAKKYHSVEAVSLMYQKLWEEA